MIRAGVRRFFHLALRRRDRWEAEVEDEIKLHLALRAEQLAADGRSPDEAYAEAVRRFGHLTESRSRLLAAARHREQNMQRTEYFQDLRQDLAFAMRTLARQKAWAFVTIATLALGIAATTAVFSVVSTMLLHPLPYPNAERVVWVEQQPSEGNNTGLRVSIVPGAPVVRAWMRDSHTLEAIQGQTATPRLLKTKSDAPSVVTTFSLFPTFPAFAGVHPLAGRFFTQQDIENGAHVIALGESFWRNRLGGDRGVIGQLLTLNDTSYTIIGVMPASLNLGTNSTSSLDVLMPLDVRADSGGMSVMARLRPGATTQAAEKELDSIYARSTGMPADGSSSFRTVVSRPAQRLEYHDSLIMLAGAVALVLLVACANVAHLLLARSATRQRELAIRTALGAGRGRIARQLLTEVVLLCFTATAIGVVGGWIGLRTMVTLRPRSLDALVNAHLDGTTLTIAVIVALISGLLFTIIGASHARRTATTDALKSGSLGAGSSRTTGRARDVLVISEMALSATLLVTATLLVRTVISLQHADLGYDARGLYVMNIPFSYSTGRTGPALYDNEPARADVIRQLMARLHSIPTVQSATIATVEPGSRRMAVGRLEVEGEPAPPRTSTSFTDVNSIQQNFFSTMRMHFESGGIFSDTTPHSLQLIVNAGFARKHWPAGGALGRRVRVVESDSTPWYTIVGVVNDAQTTGPGLENTAPIFYSPMSTVDPSPRLIIRLTGSATALAPATALLKQLGVKRVTPPKNVAEMNARYIAGPRFVMTLLTVLTALALILAAVGLYGMMAYTVAQQTREIGIRVALGASGDRIARSIVGRGAALAAVGAAIGLAAATWGTRVIQSQLYGVTRLDPASFAIGAAVLVGAALIACIVPTRRALAVDPMTAIRAD
jgi:predicted permease